MARVLADFAGIWAISREIQQVDAPAATFEGQGAWTPCAEGLAYAESGLLHITGQQPFKAQRRYRWDHDLNIFFEDGRFFHRVPIQGGNAAHWCDPDQYDVVYDFAHWPAWSCTWRVRGPRKDYVMHSFFSKT